ncbi:hypothetical protein GOODEAATRI_018362, partial [Goodea atripinnis]
SHRSRASRVRQHLHCDSCYSRRCRARVEVSVSCALVPCRLLCGAVFHLCKEEDHLLLCPNVRVPCLNGEYGCPVQLPRSSQAAHLQVCPASVVCCSMEWLRWPTDETNPHSFNALQDNVMKESDMQGEALDVAMALVDQSDLYARLKMKTIYPELMEQEEEEIKEEIKEDIAINKEKYNLFEMMFNMDRGACAVAEENLENQKQKPAEQGRSQNLTAQERQDKTRAEQKHIEGDSSAAARSCPPPDTSKTGQAPWQEGVLDRLGQELTPHEYNMYMVHHGRMLLAFGQIDACTPRKRDFVYGSLEPIPVQTLRSFKISDTKGADGLYVDIGTQTHSFRTAPFKQNTTLVELMVDRPQKLLLQLQAESVNSRNNRASCAFTFLCGHTYHRKEFASHFRLGLRYKCSEVDACMGHVLTVFHLSRNVHSDIQMCLSDWFEQRCPLAYLGCTYRQRRFHPSTQKATVNYK